MQALIIDDAVTTRRVIAAMLRELGFSVVGEAGNGREGLARLAQVAKPALLVVDWNMPELDGIGFLRAVRADPAYDGVRLLMVTSETEMSHVATALSAGADEYVMKPFSKEMLAEKLAILGFGAGGSP
jgi:two-component system chemotaxis response regulator CheY